MHEWLDAIGRRWASLLDAAVGRRLRCRCRFVAIAVAAATLSDVGRHLFEVRLTMRTRNESWDLEEGRWEFGVEKEEKMEWEMWDTGSCMVLA